MSYKLYYWSMLPGRGEFIRLILKQAGVHYEDVTRNVGNEAMLKMLNLTDKVDNTNTSCPVLETPEGKTLSQTMVISAYLAKNHDLMPTGDEMNMYYAMQINNSVHDLVSEAHNVHHPISTALTFEEQKETAIEAAGLMVSKRIPKYLDHFERSIKVHSKGEAPFLFGKQVCFVDLALMHVMRGLEYMFPRAMATHKVKAPSVVALYKAVLELPKIKEYLDSDEAMDFNENGIFRHYAVLDLDSNGKP